MAVGQKMAVSKGKKEKSKKKTTAKGGKKKGDCVY